MMMMVGESREPERIDIELTSNDDAPGWGRPPVAAGGGDPQAATGAGIVTHDDGIHQRRIWGTVAIAVVALSLGWMLGRSGSSNDESAVDAAVTTDRSPTTTEQIDEVIAGVGPVVTVASTVPVVVPVTAPRTFEQTTADQAEVHESLAGLPLELVALGSGRRIISLDLESGRLETRVIDTQPFGRATLFAGDGWLLLPSWDEDLPSTLIRDDAAPESVEVGQAWQLLGSPGTNVLWRVGPELYNNVIGDVEQIGFDGSVVGESVELPSAPLVADPAGGLVVQVPGGVFQVQPAGATRITPGRLVAIGAEHALTHECDELLRCDYAIVDRSTGLRSALPLDPALGEQPNLETTWTATSGSAFSPDGRAVAVEWIDPERGFRRALVVLDLATGSAIEVAASPEAVPFTWSPDGRTLLYVQGGRLSALDLTTATSSPVVDELVAIETFALRPLVTAG